MKHQTGCLICGKELVYLPHNELLACLYCGNEFEANARCVQGHYVCDACHSLGANDLIEQYCVQSASSDPLEMAVTLMSHPSVNMHGPEHHFLVPAVLLAAYYHKEEEATGEPVGELRVEKIRQARRRAETVKGGSCGFNGNCGAGVGTGIFISLITGATPLSKRAWQLSNRMTAVCLMSIAEHGGPRCCKRDTYLALQSARDFLSENFDVHLEMQEPIRCSFFPMNKECLKEECPFFPG